MLVLRLLLELLLVLQRVLRLPWASA